MRQPDRDGCVGGCRFVLAQPGPFRGRERGHRPAANSVRQPFGADRLRERRCLWRGARVVPQHRRAQRSAIRTEHNQPVLLPPDRDGRDVSGTTRLRERGPERLPPFARVRFACAAFATDRVPGAAAGDDAARIRIDHQHFRRLGRRIDARNQRAHATSVEFARRGRSTVRNARLHHERGGDRARSFRQRTVVAGLPPSRRAFRAATSTPEPCHPERRSHSASRRPPRPPGWKPHRVPRAPLLTSTGAIDGREPTTTDPSARVVRRERHVDVSLQRRHTFILKRGHVSVMTSRHDRLSRVWRRLRRGPRPTPHSSTSG